MSPCEIRDCGEIELFQRLERVFWWEESIHARQKVKMGEWNFPMRRFGCGWLGSLGCSTSEPSEPGGGSCGIFCGAAKLWTNLLI